jgi:uncharacterized membrane protein YfcA
MLFSPVPLLCGLSVGLILGLTGGGGAILAVPLLIYVLGFRVNQAVAISLGIVAISSLYGAIAQRRGGQVWWGTGIAIGCGGILGIPLGMWLANRVSERMTLLLFAGLMAFIGARMIFSRRGPRAPRWLRCPDSSTGGRIAVGCGLRLLGVGVVTGTLSRLFGVGGGFLIVPALIAVAGLGVAEAMATSLVAILIISTIGLVSHAQTILSIPLMVPSIFLVGSLIGVHVGVRFKSRIAPRLLQILFGVIVLIVAGVVIVANI